MHSSRYYRIRGRNALGEDVSRAAWERGEVGIWYGAWSADDWWDAVNQHRPTQDYLSGLPHQAALWAVPKAYADTARRFCGINDQDWIVAVHGGALHLAKVAGPMQSSRDHPLNCGAETFKFRRLIDGRSFRLSQLPDSYRLIPSAGRGNVHEFHGTNRVLVALLATASSEADVAARFDAMSPRQWLDTLGPAGWESFCLGYLIEVEGFIPTGLSPGRTLPALDLVGASTRSGRRILAQCKKDPIPTDIDSCFLEACSEYKDRASVYYFAYGGLRDAPPWVKVVSRDAMIEWLSTEPGASHLTLWMP